MYWEIHARFVLFLSYFLGILFPRQMKLHRDYRCELRIEYCEEVA